jgi:hypothetical protein
MNFGDLLSLAPKIIPLIPRIEKAIATAQRIMADPDVRDALAVAAEVGTLVEAQTKVSVPVAEKSQQNAVA